MRRERWHQEIEIEIEVDTPHRAGEAEAENGSGQSSMTSMKGTELLGMSIQKGISDYSILS